MLADSPETRRRPERRPKELNWDLVLKRNSIERLKKDKQPIGIVDELPDLIERGYEDVSEEDIVRLQWYGLYHDKPKVGYFMLRVKITGGLLTPLKLRVIGELSQKYGENYGELTTRQNIQLHYIKLDYLPDIFDTLKRNGMTTVGGCGDNVRNITGSPVAGIDAEELFDVRPVIQEAADFFYGNPDYADLPRKHKITIAACPRHSNAPEINCIALVGAVVNGVEGFGVRVGGGLSTVPRMSQDMGVWFPKEETIEVLRAIIDEWQEDLQSRMSRVKARLKFFVDRIGPEEYRERVEKRLGRTLADFTIPDPVGKTDHIGVFPQKQDGLSYIGFPAFTGLMTGEQMLQVADLVESYGGDIRITRQQNFILGDIPNEKLDEVVARVEEIGYPLNVNPLRAASIACTGNPLCNYAVADTKPKLREIVTHLEEQFGDAAGPIQIALDGCPHACAHHWIGSIGLQGTTLRERDEDGNKLEGYDIYLRGGLGIGADAGRPILKRVPAPEAQFYVERLVRAWLEERTDGESIRDFYRRKEDEEIIAIGTGEAPVAA